MQKYNNTNHQSSRAKKFDYIYQRVRRDNLSQNEQQTVAQLISIVSQTDAKELVTETYGEFEETLLHTAARKGHSLVVCALLEKGAGQKQTDEEGYTAFDLAVKYEKFSVLPEFFSHPSFSGIKEKVNHKQFSCGKKDLLSLLSILIKRGENQLIKLALDQGIDQSATHTDEIPAYIALIESNNEAFDALLDHPSFESIKSKIINKKYGNEQMTLLHHATIRKNVPAMQKILQHMDKQDQYDAMGRLPVHVAFEIKELQITKTIMEDKSFQAAGEINCRRIYKGPPRKEDGLLHVAVKLCAKDICSFLIHNYPETLTQKNIPYQQTPLQTAIMLGLVDMVELILKEDTQYVLIDNTYDVLLNTLTNASRGKYAIDQSKVQAIRELLGTYKIISDQEKSNKSSAENSASSLPVAPVAHIAVNEVARNEKSNTIQPPKLRHKSKKPTALLEPANNESKPANLKPDQVKIVMSLSGWNEFVQQCRFSDEDMQTIAKIRNAQLEKKEPDFCFFHSLLQQSFMILNQERNEVFAKYFPHDAKLHELVIACGFTPDECKKLYRLLQDNPDYATDPKDLKHIILSLMRSANNKVKLTDERQMIINDLFPEFELFSHEISQANLSFTVTAVGNSNDKKRKLQGRKKLPQEKTTAKVPRVEDTQDVTAILDERIAAQCWEFCSDGKRPNKNSFYNKTKQGCLAKVLEITPPQELAMDQDKAYAYGQQLKSFLIKIPGVKIKAEHILLIDKDEAWQKNNTITKKTEIHIIPLQDKPLVGSIYIYGPSAYNFAEYMKRKFPQPQAEKKAETKESIREAVSEAAVSAEMHESSVMQTTQPNLISPPLTTFRSSSAYLDYQQQTPVAVLTSRSSILHQVRIILQLLQLQFQLLQIKMQIILLITCL